MEHREKSFFYHYSAPRQDEVRAIRKKYLPKPESKLEQLRQLDEHVTHPGIAASVTLGIVGLLILGIGMCCCLVWDSAWFISGVVIGCVGILGIALAYPVYVRITEKERKRIAPEILRLTNELMGGQP